MPQEIVLASGSPSRAAMLTAAGVPFRVAKAKVDEEALRDALLAEGTTPRDLSDALAEMKALRVSAREPGAVVIGSDQVLDFGGEALSKQPDREAARALLMRLRGQRHSLFSAAVICEDGKPVWRHVSEVKLMMRMVSDAYLDEYLDRNWPDVSGAVGCYHYEAEGARLFTQVTGDYHSILGMPLLPLLNYLTTRGLIPG